MYGNCIFSAFLDFFSCTASIKTFLFVQAVQFYWEVYVFYYQSDVGLDDVKVKTGMCSSSRGGSGTTSASTTPTVVTWTTKTKPESTTTEAATTAVTPTSMPATQAPIYASE